MTQNQSPLLAHALLLVAVVTGIVGMGTVFNASVGGNLRELAFGLPVLLTGLWWSGQELGRSMILSRERKSVRRPPSEVGTAADRESVHGYAESDHI